MSFYRRFFTSFAVAFALCITSFPSFAGALVSAMPISIDSRIKTLVYNPNEVFQVVFNHGYHSYIEFSVGESVRVIAMGDNANWKVKPIDNKIFIMPLAKEGHTNMLVETSKGRSYAFDLVSKSLPINSASKRVDALRSPDSPLSDIAYVVRFYYAQNNLESDPRTRNLEISAPSLAHGGRTDNVVIRPNGTSKNYVYTATSTEDELIPLQTFDDGTLTYFQFPDKDILPKIYSIRQGVKVPCKMLFLKGYIVIEGVHKQIYLDYGSSSVEVSNRAL